MIASLKKIPTTPNLPAILSRNGIGSAISKLKERAEAVRCERDMVSITVALARLNERQLNRIGLSRTTLTFDLDRLAERTEQDRRSMDDILALVSTPPQKMIAAE